MNAHFYHLEKLIAERQASGRSYTEFLRVPAMSAGIYFLPRGAKDPQSPHQEDEMYYVVKGKARMVIGTEHSEVITGSVIFVEARAEHRFYDIEEDLLVLVFFAPAEKM
ncbi:MAG TPA: cupin domain-containing protein [Candidatus Angelobacter sp.]|nr:cupin domain-containing protein [Candidatus Angelobacter sp.]